MTRALKVLALAAPLLFASPSYAATVAIGEQITNGSFSSGLTGWTQTGTTQTRLSTDVINTQGGSAGFNSFFGTRFALLGDIEGNITNQTWDVYSSIAQTFTLAPTIGGTDVFSYDLVISFLTAFDGRDSTGALHDVFLAELVTPTGTITLFSQTSSGFPDVAPSTSATNNQLVNNPFSASIFGLAPGSYTIRFVLDEKADPSESIFTNTAAGIDSVSITGTAIPNPGTMALLGLGIVVVGVMWGRKPS